MVITTLTTFFQLLQNKIFIQINLYNVYTYTFDELFLQNNLFITNFIILINLFQYIGIIGLLLILFLLLLNLTGYTIRSYLIKWIFSFKILPWRSTKNLIVEALVLRMF